MASVKLHYFDLMNPVIRALKTLGGSGTIEEINNKVAEIENIRSEQLEILHNPEKGGATEIEYRIAWARTYLKQLIFHEFSKLTDAEIKIVEGAVA